MTKARDIASAIPAPSTVSSAELGYLDGVTSAIQTQIDTKAPSSTAVTLTGTQTLTNKTLTSPVIASVVNNTLTSTTGDMIYASAANTPARLGIGSSAQVLTVASGVPSWTTPAAGGGMTLINSGGTTLTGASITISSIPGTYKDLRLYLINPRPATAGEGNGGIRLNGDTGNNYRLTGTNQIYRESFNTSYISAGPESTDGATSGAVRTDFSDYATAGIFKNVLSLSSATSYSSGDVTMERIMAVWKGGDAITSITIKPNSGNWTSGTAYLYGVS